MHVRGHLLPSVRLASAAAAGRMAGRLSRLGRLGAGETIAGRVTLAVAPAAMERLAGGRRVVLVTGTNGKTTTTRMIGAALGEHVCTNATGANLASGIVSALLHDDASTAVLEVDELFLADAIRRTKPSVVVLLNLSRDQLDRMHDLRRVGRAWTDALQATDAVVVA